MEGRHKLGTSPDAAAGSGGVLKGAPRISACLAYLPGMDTNSAAEPFEPLLSTTELAERLHVSVQTLYDLRSHGRGPRGFRVGRELRFRASEIHAWLGRMEADDASRHPDSQAATP